MANVRKFLDLSTAHLTLAMRDELPDYSREGGAPSWGGTSGVYPTEYGALVWVPDNPEESAAAGDEPVPPELLVIHLHARKHGCDYVLFDRDAEADPKLPVFEEEATAAPAAP